MCAPARAARRARIGADSSARRDGGIPAVVNRDSPCGDVGEENGSLQEAAAQARPIGAIELVGVKSGRLAGCRLLRALASLDGKHLTQLEIQNAHEATKAD